MLRKRKVFISNHGQFDQFGMNISLPAIIELTEDQISFINNTGLYKIEDLNSRQTENTTSTEDEIINGGDRFSRKRSISVNELTFKAPIMGTAYASKAKDAIIVKKGSIYEKQALEQVSDKPIENKYNVSENVTVGAESTKGRRRGSKISSLDTSAVFSPIEPESESSESDSNI